MLIIEELFKSLWEVWTAMFMAVWDVLPKAISFILWVLSAFVILPCVLVAGQLYPLWTDWGESF